MNFHLSHSPLLPGHWPVRNDLVRILMSRECAECAAPWLEYAGNPPAECSRTWHCTIEERPALDPGKCPLVQAST